MGKPIRARVLQVESGQASLGIYVDGRWQRLRARVEGVRLQPNEWIRGTLIRRQDGTIYFQGIQRDET